MEEINFVNLPVIGRVQHGLQIEKDGKKIVKELGYFIAKSDNSYMKKYMEKFNELYKGKKYIEIEFVNNTPLTKKYIRYNQGGDTCHCFEGNNIGSQKTENGWKPIECDINNCKYRQKDKNGKSICNKVGWLKFLIPTISKDRVWLMKITSQRSIKRLSDWILFQQGKNKSLNNTYILFLKQEEDECKATGKKFNNYALDIMIKEDFSFDDNIQETTEKSLLLSTEKGENVDNNIQNINNSSNKIQNAKKENNTIKKMTTKTTNKNVETKQKSEEKENSLGDCYILMRTYNQNINQKNGEKKSYVMGEFYNMQDEKFDVAIKPEDAQELQNCEMGTVTRLKLKTIGNIHFALKIEYIQKCEKNIAA